MGCFDAAAWKLLNEMRRMTKAPAQRRDGRVRANARGVTNVLYSRAAVLYHAMCVVVVWGGGGVGVGVLPRSTVTPW